MKKQAGFTLVELVVSLSLMGLVVTGAASGIFYALKANSQVMETLPALNSIQIAGRWVCRDAQMACYTNMEDGAPPVNPASTPVEFYWTDYYSDTPVSHTIIYTLSGNELQRDEDGQITVIARGISAVAFSIASRASTVTISSAGQDRTYQAYLRPK